MHHHIHFWLYYKPDWAITNSGWGGEKKKKNHENHFKWVQNFSFFFYVFKLTYVVIYLFSDLSGLWTPLEPRGYIIWILRLFTPAGWHTIRTNKSILFCFVCLWDRVCFLVCVCSPDRLELRDLLAFASQALRLKACATILRGLSWPSSDPTTTKKTCLGQR